MNEEQLNESIKKLNQQVEKSTLHLGAVLGAYKKLASEHVQVGTLFELVMEYLMQEMTDDQRKGLKEYVDIRFSLKYAENRSEFLDPVLKGEVADEGAE